VTSIDSINLVNTTGQLVVNNAGNPNAIFSAKFITLNSPDGILLDTPGQGNIGTLTLTAGNQITSQVSVKNDDLSGTGQLNISARTIVLSDVALPDSGNTTFAVGDGKLAANPNTQQQIVNGELNFFKNVTYQGELANTPGVGFTVTTLGQSPIPVATGASVTASTIVLGSISSGSSTFAVANGSLSPNPNTGQQIVNGELNFINNVTYQGQLANTPGVGFTVHTLAGH
jgi:hypothetical protein